MDKSEVMKELEAYGDERTKNTLIKHGAKEPFFGVKVADLKESRAFTGTICYREF